MLQLETEATWTSRLRKTFSRLPDQPVPRILQIDVPRKTINALSDESVREAFLVRCKVVTKYEVQAQQEHCTDQ